MELLTLNKEAFVYCWTDFGTNKLYVGVHKGTPDDGYMCSSNLMLEEYTKRPNDFSRQIIAFGSFKEMYVLETAILKAAKADKDTGYYNATLNHGPFYCKGPHTEKHKEKLRGIRRSDEANRIRSERMRGHKHSEETKRKIAKKRIGTKQSMETCRKKSILQMGRKRGPYRKNGGSC